MDDVAQTPLLVALIGFMGAGKSTVGRILAAELGAEFLDLDDLIVERASATIPEIFALRGEAAFREIESACLRALAAASAPTVLAAGGGAPVSEANRPFFAERARTFYLAAPFGEVVARIAGDGSRPLLSGSLDDLRRLYESRLSVYEALGHRVDAGGRPPEEIAREVARLLVPPGSPRS
jgi:shikimate kinase